MCVCWSSICSALIWSVGMYLTVEGMFELAVKYYGSIRQMGLKIPVRGRSVQTSVLLTNYT